MWKILSILFFLLSLPVILILILGSLVLFGNAPTCPESTQKVNSNALQLKAQDLDKKGFVTLTSAELTSIIRMNEELPIENFNACFSNGKLNASGNIKAGNFSPSFYLSTELIGDPSFHLQNTEVSLGWIGKVPGFSKLFGSIAEGMVNDKFSQMPTKESYSININGDNLEVKVNNQKKKTNIQ
jgi:hypothetical protein